MDLPQQYRSWVLAGILTSLVGYLSTTIVHLVEGYGADIVTVTDPYILALDVVALGLWAKGRARKAVGLVLGGIWIDLHVSLVIIGDPTEVFSILVLPVFVMCTGLLYGGKVVFAASVATAATVPLAIYLAQVLDTGPGFGAPRSGLLLVILESVLVATTFLVTVFLTSFAAVLKQSRNNEKRAKELIENAPDAIISFSEGGRVEALNHAARELLGIASYFETGLRYEELPLFGINQSWSHNLEDLALLSDPIELLAGDRKIPVEAMVRPTTKPDGTQGIMMVLRNITVRRAAEEQAQDLQRQLLHTQKLEAMGRLAGGMAHDFNNILTGVSGYGTLFMDSPDPETREMGEELKEMQERGTALINQLLAFARKDRPLPRPMDIGQTVTGMSALLKRLIGERVELSIQASAPCPIVADPGKMEQVVLNLAANARDAMPQGGTLTIRCDAEEDAIVLTVSDTGIGMSQETQSKIFEPFFTTKDRGKGTGLGLSMVHGIVSESGGTITVDTVLGEGTRFTLQWQRTDERQSSIPPKQTAPFREGNGEVIFVAEDDVGARSFLKRFLTKRGFTVMLAKDGEEALDVLTFMDDPPNLILSDVVMPRLTGPQFVKEIRKRWPTVPVLFMSGYLGEAGNEFGSDTKEYILRKPFKTTELMSRVFEKLSQVDESPQPP